MVGALTPCSIARDSQEGQSPGTAAGRAGLVLQRRENRPEKRYERERSATFCEGNAPKGESHERRRRETEPTGVRGEETVVRVVKP